MNHLVKVKNGIFYCIFSLLLYSCGGKTTAPEDGKAIFFVKNTLNKERKSQEVIITRKEIAKIFRGIPKDMFPCVELPSGKLLPHQTDDLNSDGRWDEFSFQIDLPPKNHVKIILSFKRIDESKKLPIHTAVLFRHKNDGQFDELTEYTTNGSSLSFDFSQQFLAHGLLFENQSTLWRFMLDGSNMLQFLGKPNSNVILLPKSKATLQQHSKQINSAFKNYEVIDYAASLGIGSIGMKIGKDVYRLGYSQNELTNNIDSLKVQILSSGPVRSIIRFDYFGWKVKKEKLDLSQLITIWANSNFYDSKVFLKGIHGKNTLVLGVVNKDNNKPFDKIDFTSKYLALLSFDKQDKSNTKQVGFALLLPKTNYFGAELSPESNESIEYSYLAKIKVENKEPISYCAFAGWETNDINFINKKEFLAKIKDRAERLSAPVSLLYAKK